LRKKAKTAYEKWLAANPLRKWIDARRPKHGAVIELAHEIECSAASIFAWMSGLSTPTLGYLWQIEDKTGITANELLRWKNRKPKGPRNVESADMRDAARIG
jgi:hypothetical protein